MDNLIVDVLFVKLNELLLLGTSRARLGSRLRTLQLILFISKFDYLIIIYSFGINLSTIISNSKILTKDSVTVSVDAVVYFRIFNAVISVINVEDAAKSTKLLAASTLRNILGMKSLHEILSDRESVAILIQVGHFSPTQPVYCSLFLKLNFEMI